MLFHSAILQGVRKKRRQTGGHISREVKRYLYTIQDETNILIRGNSEPIMQPRLTRKADGHFFSANWGDLCNMVSPTTGFLKR